MTHPDGEPELALTLIRLGVMPTFRKKG